MQLRSAIPVPAVAAADSACRSQRYPYVHSRQRESISRHVHTWRTRYVIDMGANHDRPFSAVALEILPHNLCRMGRGTRVRTVCIDCCGLCHWWFVTNGVTCPPTGRQNYRMNASGRMPAARFARSRLRPAALSEPFARNVLAGIG